MPQIPTEIMELVLHYRKYFKWSWHLISEEKPIWNWHIDYIANQLQILGSFIIERAPSPGDLIINIPPGMTKSSLVTQAFLSWLWLHDPSLCVIISSYSDGLSVDHSLKAKSIVLSDEWEFFNSYVKAVHGKRLQLIKETEKYWINNYGGFFFATSTGGTVTGKHAHLIIRDDPLNPEQAESEAHRKKCNRFNDKTLSSRKKDKDNTPTITVMQRLHEDDPTGHDLEKVKESGGAKRVKHICLPGKLSDKAKPEEVKKYYKDGLLDPVRLSEATLKVEKVNLGSFAYAGQYDQNPAPIEGGLVKIAWLEKVDRVPPDLPVNFVIDTAFTTKTQNDPCGILAYCWDPATNLLYIKEGVSDKFEFPQLVEFVKTFTTRNGYTDKSRIYIELKTAGYPLLQTLKQTTSLNVMGTQNPDTDKITRLTNKLPFVESMRVKLIRGSWNNDFINEVCIFPNGKHDEYVDLLVYAIDNRGSKSFKLSKGKKKRQKVSVL